MKKVIVIGCPGSGKSTVAKEISKKLNILYLDTGAMYRATAVKAISLGIDTLDENGVDTFINNIDLKIKYINGAQCIYSGTLCKGSSDIPENDDRKNDLCLSIV